jgi:hypothetical protein
MYVYVESSVFQRLVGQDESFVSPAGPTYSPSGLKAMTESARNAIGIFTLNPGERPDDRDYIVTEVTPAMIGGQWYRQFTTVAKLAANFKDSFKRDIDAAAEGVRLKYITDGSGQAAVYILKEREATACLAGYTSGSPPAEGIFPLLDASVGIEINPLTLATCANAYAVAVVVDILATQWKTVAAVIENKRLGAKRAVDEATTMAELRAAANVDWTIE